MPPLSVQAEKCQDARERLWIATRNPNLKATDLYVRAPKTPEELGSKTLEPVARLVFHLIARPNISLDAVGVKKWLTAEKVLKH